MKKRLQDIIWKVEKLGASDLLTEVVTDLSNLIEECENLPLDSFHRIVLQANDKMTKNDFNYIVKEVSHVNSYFEWLVLNGE